MDIQVIMGRVVMGWRGDSVAGVVVHDSGKKALGLWACCSGRGSPTRCSEPWAVGGRKIGETRTPNIRDG